jgi:hypothetical protein
LDTGLPLLSEEVDAWLRHEDLEASFEVVGTAARLDLLHDDLCEDIISRQELNAHVKGPWMKGELRLRLDLNRALRQPQEFRWDLIDGLLHQKWYWPFEQLIGQLTADELVRCEAALEDSAALTGSSREAARQAIRAEHKRRLRSLVQ